MLEYLLHPPKVIRHIELGAGLLLDLLDLDTRRKLSERQAALLAINLEDALENVSVLSSNLQEGQDLPVQ